MDLPDEDQQDEALFRLESRIRVLDKRVKGLELVVAVSIVLAVVLLLRSLQ